MAVVSGERAVVGENWRWGGLSVGQIEGMNCVICARSFREIGRIPKAVGSAFDTGRPVFACAAVGVESCFGWALSLVKGWRADLCPGEGER